GQMPSGFASNFAADVIGTITLDFEEWDQRPPAAEILAEVRSLTEGVAGAFIEVREQEHGPPVGKPIQIQLASRNQQALEDAATRVRSLFESMPELVDIEDTRPVPGIEWELQVDRAQAARFGLDLSAVGENVRLMTNGLIVGNWRPDTSDDEVDIV